MAWTRPNRTELRTERPPFVIKPECHGRTACRALCEHRPTKRDPFLQFMILLSALLASLSGLVGGERAPVHAPQVQASAVVSAVSAEAAATVSQARIAPAHVAGPERRTSEVRHAAPLLSVRTRLTLKQSWLE